VLATRVNKIDGYERTQDKRFDPSELVSGVKEIVGLSAGFLANNLFHLPDKLAGVADENR
jgi:hypothetical protein